MKIIAQVDRKTFHLEATSNEIANLIGRPSAISIDNPRVLEPGFVIRVDAAYQYVQWIYQHRERFERLARDLRGHADSIDKFPELFEMLSIPTPDELKKAKAK